MAISRAYKEEILERYQGGLAAAPHVFLVSFQGVTVAQVDDLRRRVREAGGSYEVVKNRLAKLATEGKPLGVLAEHLQGATAVAYHGEDPVQLAKVLTTFAKEVPAITFKAALVDGQPVGGEQVQAIADLPSREELITKLLFLLQSPVSRFVRGLGAIPQQFVSVLDQIRQKKEQG